MASYFFFGFLFFTFKSVIKILFPRVNGQRSHIIDVLFQLLLPSNPILIQIAEEVIHVARRALEARPLRAVVVQQRFANTLQRFISETAHVMLEKVSQSFI